MPNPILPLWEYIPDGEPRLFGDRVYLYGSHDRTNSDAFCDFKLKVWSASIHQLNHWQCHGHSFHTLPDRDHPSDTPWTTRELYAPDVVSKDGKYYLYAYILGSKGCVGVSDVPEGPFKLLSTYQYAEGQDGDEGIYNDAGVLVDDDGKVYIYYGFERNFINELDGSTMVNILDGSLKADVLSQEEPFRFFEASSPRKINGIYYLIYSPRIGSRLAYATSTSPTGPFEYRGYIIDNGKDYPAGNNHGSVCFFNDQWWVFYHRMTNNSIMSRRACVERIEILPDGSIPEVEMTSLGFDTALSPYENTPAELACVLKGGCMIVERTPFMRPITAITDACVIGYKYFDFGVDHSNTTLKFCASIRGTGSSCVLKLFLDDPVTGTELGHCEIGMNDGVYATHVPSVTGRHALYFVVESSYGGWFVDSFKGRHLFELESFQFMK